MRVFGILSIFVTQYDENSGNRHSASPPGIKPKGSAAPARTKTEAESVFLCETSTCELIKYL